MDNFKIMFVCLVFLIMALLSCKREEQECEVDCDYVISHELEIAIPESGTPTAWIYIIGGNRRGTKYVAPWGNDSNDGSFEHPWKTLRHSVSQLVPGDTLIVLPGNGRSRPLIMGMKEVRTAFDLSGRSYIWMENLEITHYPCGRGNTIYFWDGIAALDSPAHNLVFKDIYIHHIDGFGMNFCDIDSVQILNCRLEYCGFGALGGPPPQHGGWRHVVIRGCTLSYSGHYYRGTNDARPAYDRPDGFGIEPSSGPILIENTIAAHNYGDGIDSKAESTTVIGCIVANNTCDGIKLWGDGSKMINCLIYGRGDGDNTRSPWSPICFDQIEKPNAEFEVINCTIDDQLGGNYVLYIQYDAPYANIPIKVTLKNTIISSRGPEAPIYVRGSCTFIAENCLFYIPNSEWVLEYGDSIYTQSTIVNFGTGNIYGDPLFVKTGWGTEGDYHLRDGSPAIDRGTPNGAPNIDLDGNQRPLGSGYDIGCYER